MLMRKTRYQRRKKQRILQTNVLITSQRTIEEKKTYSLLYSSFQTYYTTIFWCPADTLFNCFYCGQCFVTLSNTYRLIHQKLVPPFVFGIFLVRVKSAFGTQPLCSTDVSVMHISVINISIIHTSTALLFFGRKKTFWGKATWMSICQNIWPKKEQLTKKVKFWGAKEIECQLVPHLDILSLRLVWLCGLNGAQKKIFSFCKVNNLLDMAHLQDTF